MPGSVPTTSAAVPESLQKLSPFPLVAIRAMDLLNDEKAETTALVQVISSDPVFVADLLYCANSALFGIRSESKTLRHAIVVLGRERLMGVILTTALRAFLKGPPKSAQYHAWWRHSLATALLSDGLTVAGSLQHPGAYAAGLLHDIGRLALLTGVKESRYREYLCAAEIDELASESLPGLERRFFGTDHCEIGERLLKEWKFSGDLGLAAKHHHDPGQRRGMRGSGVVGIACRLAAWLGFEAIKRPRQQTEAELLACLPTGLRAGYLDCPDSIRSALAERINSLGGFGSPPSGATNLD